MEYKVEEVSPTQRKVVVDVSVEEINAALATAVALYKRSADIKGFRKGKAPSDMIESRYHKQIYQEATNDLLNFHINEIMGELKLMPISRIDPDAEEIVRDQPFHYSFTFEVAPPIELPEYTGIEVEQEEPSVDEKEIDAVIEKIRNNLAQFIPPKEPRAPQDGDTVNVSFQALDGDKPVEGIKANNFDLTLGEGQALPEFEKIIKGLMPGETGQESISFPEDFLNKELAGKTVTMRVTLHAVKVKKLPEVNDEFAKKAGGFESVEKLREAVNKSYVDSRTQMAKSAAEKKILDDLLAKVDFPLPETLVGQHIERMVSELTGKLERHGKGLESLGKSPEELRESFRPEAEYLTRVSLFLLAVANKEDLKVSNHEIDAYLQQISMKTGQDFQTIKRFHEENGLIVPLKDRILSDKAMELIYDKANVKKVPPKKSEAEESEASAS